MKIIKTVKLIKNRPAHRTQSPMRFDYFMLFLKAVYVWIFRNSSGLVFDAAYLHDLKPKVVDFTLEGPVLSVVPLRL